MCKRPDRSRIGRARFVVLTSIHVLEREPSVLDAVGESHGEVCPEVASSDRSFYAISRPRRSHGWLVCLTVRDQLSRCTKIVRRRILGLRSPIHACRFLSAFKRLWVRERFKCNERRVVITRPLGTGLFRPAMLASFCDGFFLGSSSSTNGRFRNWTISQYTVKDQFT